MVFVVTSKERSRYAHLLSEMHRHRKRVFIDRLGWPLPVADGEFEFDQFDTIAAAYLLATSATGELIGSVRLLPSAGPHLLGDIYPHLCQAGVPRAPDVVEISRFCTSPELRSPWEARRKLFVALAEYALVRGIRRYSCVTHRAGAHQLAAVGCEIEPLGAPRREDGELIQALAIEITPGTLRRLRRRTRIAGPVVDWIADHAA